MRVKLTCSEMMLAATAGVMRQVENVKLGRAGSCGVDPWTAHVEGAMAEFALAKGLGLHWSGKGVFRGADVANLQVRSTPYSSGCLALQPDDDDEAIFWLVTGSMGTYDLRGAIVGSEGKQQQWWEHKPGTHRAAYYVPQAALIQPAGARGEPSRGESSLTT